MLSAADLLAGSSLTFEVDVPAAVMHPGNGAGPVQAGSVRLRPLTVTDLQIIARAAKDSDSLNATLMVQRALVEPAMSIAEVAALHVGLMEFLLAQVNRISGIGVSSDQLLAAAEEPLVKAAFVLAAEFGWTPQQVGELTLGQVLLHLQMLRDRDA